MAPTLFKKIVTFSPGASLGFQSMCLNITNAVKKLATFKYEFYLLISKTPPVPGTCGTHSKDAPAHFLGEF